MVNCGNWHLTGGKASKWGILKSGNHARKADPRVLVAAIPPVLRCDHGRGVRGLDTLGVVECTGERFDVTDDIAGVIEREQIEFRRACLKGRVDE